MDRNWSDILQELRVTQTGTQILTGFLLAIAFQPKFDTLTLFQQRTYLFLVLAAVTTTAWVSRRSTCTADCSGGTSSSDRPDGSCCCA